MPAMSSGMEAEEETEHHLMRAIATETLSTGKKFIPTPDAMEVDYYKEFYTDVKYMTRRWKQGYLCQDLTLMDEKPPEYNLDDEDEEFRQTLATPSMSELELERNLDLLEEAETTKGQLAPFCRDWNWGKGIIGEGHHHKKIHQYWVKKRTRLNGPIKFRLLREKPIDTTNCNESYICFRRRLDKIQTRRNKQRDQLSYTRMVKLRRDFMKLLHICTLTKQREDRKAELIEQDFRIIKSRLTNGDFNNEIYAKIKAERDKANLEQRRLNGIANLSSRPGASQIPSKKIKESKAKELVKKATNSEAGSRKRAFASLGSRSTSQVGLNGTGHGPGSHSGPLPVDPSMAAKFIFKSENTKPGAFYLEARSLSQIEKDSRDNNQETGYRLLSTQHRTLGFCRRRVGRGGRIITDRAFHTNHQSIVENVTLNNSDSELIPFLPESSNSHVNQQVRQVLDDIKKLRVRHFQPGQPRKRKRNAPSKKR